MNTKDIVNALSCVRKGEHHITLAVLEKGDIPYVKRFLLRKLGQPNKMIYNTLYYPRLTIAIYSILPKDDKPLEENISMYYVGYEGGTDEEELQNYTIVETLPVRSIEMWKSIGLGFSEMYRALLVDGYDPEEAVDILEYTNVI